MIMVFGMMLSSLSYSAIAEGELMPRPKDNLTVGLIRSCSLTPTEGGYMRVYYDNNMVRIEYYDDNFNVLSKRSIDMELPKWGGFYAGKDAYYVVQGQNNEEEDNTKEVVRVIKYSKNWEKLGTASITSGTKFAEDVRYPFNHGCVEMAEADGNLYIVTGHQGYVDSKFGMGHQGFLMLKVDTATMEGSIVDADLWHSFAQYIEAEGSDLYVLEQSEGDGITSLKKYDAKTMLKVEAPVFRYGGDRSASAWSMPCYASVDGVALSKNNVLGLGTSIDQSNYDNVSSDTAYNVVLTVTPKSNITEAATETKWLTNYSGGGKNFDGIYITKINDDKFLIVWKERREVGTADGNDALSENILHYVFVDGNGNKIGEERTAAAALSDCRPVIKGDKAVFYASDYGVNSFYSIFGYYPEPDYSMMNFYTIDINDGTFTKKSYRIAVNNFIGKITSFGGSANKASVELWQGGIKKYDVPVFMSTEYNEDSKNTSLEKYDFGDIPAGTYIMKVLKTDHVMREYTVTVGNKALPDVTINILSDVDMNGEMNMLDSQKIFAFIKNSSSITDEYQKKLADVDENKDYNMLDIQRLFNAIKKS